MSKPTTCIMSLGARRWKAVSVVIAWAAIRTSLRRPCWLGEFLRDEHGRRAAAGRRARHQPRHHAGPDHLIVHDVVGGDLLAEQRQRIVLGMPARLGADLGERRQRRAVLLHVTAAGAAEIAQRQRHAGRVDQLVGGGVEFVECAGPVGENRARARRASSARSRAPARNRARRIRSPAAPGTARSSRSSSCC